MKIILHIDFTPASDNAMDYAIKLFSNYDKDEIEYFLFHAFKPMAPYVDTGAVPVIENRAWMEESEEKISKRVEMLKSEYDLNINPIFELGGVYENVKKLEKEIEPDLLVMATREKNLFEQITFGSNALQVANKSNTPVLIIPRESQFRTPKKITFATDLEPLDVSYDSFSLFKDIVKQNESKLQVLHVFKSEEEQEKSPAFDDTALHRYMEDMEHEHKVVINNNIYEGISTFINENKPDIMVVIPRDRNFFENLFHTSITSKMTYHAEIPLLVLN